MVCLRPSLGNNPGLSRKPKEPSSTMVCFVLSSLVNRATSQDIFVGDESQFSCLLHVVLGQLYQLTAAVSMYRNCVQLSSVETLSEPHLYKVRQEIEQLHDEIIARIATTLDPEYLVAGSATKSSTSFNM